MTHPSRLGGDAVPSVGLQSGHLHAHACRADGPSQGTYRAHDSRIGVMPAMASSMTTIATASGSTSRLESKSRDTNWEVKMTVSRLVAALFALSLISMSATASLSAPYQLGSCNVTQVATGPNNVCVPVRGKTATGVAPGTSHDACTIAKQNATANLLTGIPAVCGAYITCGAPCQTIKK